MKKSILFFVLIICGMATGRIKVLESWKNIDYEFPNHHTKKLMLEKKTFIPGNPVPIDVDFWEKDGIRKMFVTTPRFMDGVPASLATVTEKSESGGPLLRPYPDWSWHTSGSKCEGMTSVFRTQIDKCGRIWAIDSGMIDLFKFPRRRLCQPQLIAFTLHNDKFAGNYKFPDSVLMIDSVLTTLAVDIRDPFDKCMDAFVYVTDVTGFAIIVYDARRNKSWRVQTNSMYPYPPHGHFKTNGEEFDLMDGIIGLGLGPVKNGDRKIYYHSFASLVESWVSSTVLRNDSLFNPGQNLAPSEFKTSVEARTSQTAPQVFDKHGNLYFSPVGENSLVCWNSEKPYEARSINQLIKDDANMQFTTGIKIREAPDGQEEIYMMTTRFHLVMVGKMKKDEVNFRILKGRLNELTRGSDCQQKRVSWKGSHYGR